jgi:hypothetical protein
MLGYTLAMFMKVYRQNKAPRKEGMCAIGG